MSFTNLKDLLPKAASKLNLEHTLKAALVITKATRICRELLSHEVFQEISVKRYKDSTLWIAVTSSAVSQEIQLKSFELQRRINEALEANLVKKIRTFQEMKSFQP